MDPPSRAPYGIDGLGPSMARDYDPILGGRPHFAVDRTLGDQLLGASPVDLDPARIAAYAGVGHEG